jgi:hypothetical protein
MSLINHYLLVGKADKNPLTEIFHWEELSPRML